MISKEAKALMTTAGFILLFIRIIRDEPTITQTGAYEKAEDEYRKHFGKAKYSGYDSFRKIKSRYLKSRKR